MVKKLDVQVRELAEPDFLEAASVWHESRKQVGTEMGFDSERAVTAEISVRVFREVIAVENLIWGAVQENCIVGILAINGSEIDRMYVRPGAQRCGIGTALLQKARELSPSGLELFTHEENRAARTSPRLASSLAARHSSPPSAVFPFWPGHEARGYTPATLPGKTGLDAVMGQARD